MACSKKVTNSDKNNGKKIYVLFVCLGNTCRSTMSEGVLKHLAASKDTGIQWVIDSAAIADWQVGNPPDKKTIKVLRKNGIHGYDETSHIARQITDDDFIKFDYILGMDEYNIEDLMYIKPDRSNAEIRMLGEFDKEDIDPQIHDPYMASERYFDKVFEKCYRSCMGFFESRSV